MRTYLIIALALSLITSTPLYASNKADTHIVTSIKPLELLVHAIATEGTQVTTLVPLGASPHNYAMTPSKRRVLEAADVIFWVGPKMETFLTRLLTGSEFNERSFALMKEEENDHDHQPEAHDEGGQHGHTHGDGEDPHIWVDPHMALFMAGIIRDTLAGLDGADIPALDRNLAAFRASLNEKEKEIRKQLEPVAGVSVFAYHSALTRFAEHYNLNIEGVLTLNPELSPGARHIAGVQKRLRNAVHPCLLTEPQFNRRWWLSITEGLDVTFSTWDPLATDIEPTARGYLAFQQSIADAVLQCSPEQTEH